MYPVYSGTLLDSYVPYSCISKGKTIKTARVHGFKFLPCWKINHLLELIPKLTFNVLLSKSLTKFSFLMYLLINSFGKGKGYRAEVAAVIRDSKA